VKQLAIRWLKFNFVGGIGIVVQLAALELLVNGLGVGYLWATAMAVETAVLHNFVWHERFTWKDRTGKQPRRAREVGARLVRFHLGNGLASILGNLVLMRLFVGNLGMKPLPANMAAIGICAVVNFAASEWFVFR